MYMKQKFGLFSYSTENIGDEVQSIAARRFLPKVDYYFDRDNIDATKTQKDEKIKLIMNGWYTKKPGNWPPKNPNLEPLLVAMHITQGGDGSSITSFLSDKSKAFLNKFGPVGTRDIATAKLLNDAGVEAYFSGCVTLTLNRDKNVKKGDFVLAVDVSDALFEKLKQQTKREVLRFDTYRLEDVTTEEKFAMAEYFLYLYQSAHCAITTRLHVMLPCLALQTPVLAIRDPERDPTRYSGLIDLTNHLTEKEYLKDPKKYDINKPPKNPDDYLALRKKLEKTCKDYTGFDDNKSYLNGKSVAELMNSTAFMSAFSKLVDASYEAVLLSGMKHRVVDLERELEATKAELAEWKNAGVKMSAKSLARATKNYFKKKRS